MPSLCFALLGVALLGPALVCRAGALADPPKVAARAARTDHLGDPLPPHARARLGTLRFRHMAGNGVGWRVTAFAFSPDGRLLASGSAGYSICLWDAATGRRLRCWETVGGGLPHALAFSADGKALVARVGADAKLYDVATGKEIPLRWPGQRFQWEDQLALSPDGNTRALLRRHKIYLRDARTDRDLYTLTEPDGREFLSLLYARDGKTLIAGGVGEKYRLYFYEVATGKLLRKSGDREAVSDANYLALSPDGKIVATGGNPIRLWETATARHLRALPGGGKDFAFSPDGKTLAVWESKTVRFYEVLTGRERGRLQGFVSDKITFAFAPHGRTAYLDDDFGVIRRVSLVTGKEIPAPDGHLGPILRAALSADGKRVASLGADGTVRVWDTAGGKQVRCVRVAPGGLDLVARHHSCALALSPDGGLVAASLGQGGVRVWDVAKGSERLGLLTDGFVRALAFSPDGARLAATGDKTWVWLIRHAEQPTRFPDLGGSGVVFSPDGKTLIGPGGRQSDADTGRPLAVFKGFPARARSAAPFAVAADGKTLVVGNSGKGVRVFDLATGAERARLVVPNHTTMALSPDGRVLATADRATIVLWDTGNGDPLLRLAGHEGQVSSLAFTPDGKTLVSAGSDTTLLMWDVSRVRPGPPPATAPRIAALPASRALLHLRDADSATAIEALAHAEPKVRMAAVERLTPLAHKDQAVLKALVLTLSEPDDEVRRAAELSFGHVKPWQMREALPQLRQALKQSRGAARLLIAGILGRMGQAAHPALPELLACLKEESDPAAVGISQALKDIDPTGEGLPPWARELLAGRKDKAARPRAPRRADAHGDPLPAGALARFGTVRLRHAGPVYGLAFSPDGKTLASAGTHAVRLWNVADGKERLRVRRDGTDNPSGVCFTPDGKEVFASGSDRMVSTVHFWDAATGKERRRFKDDLGARFTKLALSPDGKLLAISSGNARALVVDAANARLVQRIEGGLACLNFSRDGRQLLVHNKLYDPTLGVLATTFALGDRALTSADFSADGKMVATALVDPDFWQPPHRVRSRAAVGLWDAATGKRLRLIETDLDCIHQLACSPRGATLALAGTESAVRLWDAATGKEAGRLMAHGTPLKCLMFSADGKLLAAADEQGRIVIWDVAARRPLHPAVQREGWHPTLAYSPDGATLAAGDDVAIRLYDPATGKESARLEGHRGRVVSLAWGAGGKLLASGGDARDGTTRLWDAPARKEVHSFKDGGGLVALSRDGSLLASGSNPLCLRQAATGKELARFDYAKVRCLDLSPDGKLLAAASDSQSAKVYTLPGGRPLTTFGYASHQWLEIDSARFSPAGTRLVYVQGRLGLGMQLVDPATGKRSRQTLSGDTPAGTFPDETAVAWSADGKTLAVGHKAGYVALLDAETRRERGRTPAWQGEVTAVAFAPDGRTLSAAYTDGTVLVWDVAAAAQ